MADFEVSQGDTAPVLVVDLSYSDGTLPDLTGATGRFVMRDPNSATPLINAPCTLTGAKTGSTVTQATATYMWQAADTATPGVYLGQFDITFPDTSVRSFPTGGYFTVEIVADLASSYAPTADGTTLADVLNTARARLGGRPPKQNLLAQPLDNVSQTLVCTYPTTMTNVGSVLSVGVETMYVWAKSADGQTLTVGRGYAGSKPAVHSPGDLILVDPVFTDYETFVQVNNELASLPSRGLYRVKTADIITDPILLGYPLPADLIGDDVLNVSWIYKSPIQYRAVLEDYRVDINVPVNEFPTGNAIFLYKRPLPGQPFRVTYKSNFDPLAYLSQPVTDTGLPASAVDLLALGAAVRITNPMPVPRADYTRQGDPRRASEVPTRDVLSAPGALRAEYQTRLAEEVGRLDDLYGPRLTRRSVW